MKTSQRQTARAKADAKWAHLDPRRQQQEQQAAARTAGSNGRSLAAVGTRTRQGAAAGAAAMSTIKIKAPAMPEPAHRGPSGTGDYFNSFTPQQLAYRDTQWKESVLLLVNALRAADLWTDPEFDVADWRTKARAALSAITEE